MKHLAFCLALLLIASGARSQDACAPASAEATLDNAGVRAALFNSGALFWNGDGPGVYEVPKGSGVDALFLASLWVGGRTDGELRFAGSTYGPWEFWPGPLAEDGTAPTPASCETNDRIWRVTLADIAAYNESGVATDDLAGWPADLGAPVVDGDGDPATYDLARGDRPAILGDETAWWVMNDRGAEHRWGQSAPIGLEVRVTAFTVSDAYAFARLGLPRVDADALHYATIYRYALTYRGDAPFENAYLGLSLDTDLGNFGDDYVGSFPEQQIGFTYNGDDLDEGPRGYGLSPPAFGVRMLGGPAPEPLTGFMYFNGGGPTGDPSASDDRALVGYRYLQSLWKDGTPLSRGGDGYNPGSTNTLSHMYPALPPSYWSEMNSNGQGRADPPSDRGFLVSHGPFDLSSGETTEVSFALVWARSDLGHIASVNKLVVETSPRVAAVARGLEPDPALATILPADLPVLAPMPQTPEAPERTAVAQTVWPNPASGETALRVDLADAADVRLVVYDVLGREVAVPHEGPLAAAEHRLPLDVSGWAPGTYVYRLSLSPEAGPGLRASGSFVVVR